MKLTTKGFTLIELLVVVLIIGILAAVALPQYQKAVEKSRIAEALTNLQAIVKSAQLYVLENGTGEGFTIEDSVLPVSDTTHWKYTVNCWRSSCEIEAHRFNADEELYYLQVYNDSDAKNCETEHTGMCQIPNTLGFR